MYSTEREIYLIYRWSLQEYDLKEKKLLICLLSTFTVETNQTYYFLAILFYFDSFYLQNFW